MWNRYKHTIAPEHKERLKMLLRKQNHRAITDEIRRELFAPPLATDAIGTGDIVMRG